MCTFSVCLQYNLQTLFFASQAGQIDMHVVKDLWLEEINVQPGVFEDTGHKSIFGVFYYQITP